LKQYLYNLHPRAVSIPFSGH